MSSTSPPAFPCRTPETPTHMPRFPPKTSHQFGIGKGLPAWRTFLAFMLASRWVAAGSKMLRARRDLAMTKPKTVTAAVLVIGDEILSGRTKDRNLGYIAEYLAKIGVDVREARVVPDVEDDIVAALNALRGRYDYVVTTGGIGPTHDDITADAVARAFGVTIDEDPRVIAAMLQRYAPGDLTPARRRMARIPATAELIENPISIAPGFRVSNVYVMAGVPAVLQGMLDL